MPIDKNMSKDEIIAELVNSWKEHHRIGSNTHIKSAREAAKIASAIASSIKNEGEGK